MTPLLRGIPPPIGTPLIKGGRGDRHPPYQGGQGGSNLKSIFNLIITSYLAACYHPSRSPGRAITRNSRQRTKPFQVDQWLGGVKTIKPDSNPENRVRIDQCSH
ncbi:MAG: hypothetical protein EWV67_17830 [Microcystis sp. M_QC_C_20170808_M2Col]|nr:MAG: hypothetical protein EWV67_17830 [Microcystis sp. M_QC_C_20170808_M2Col]TRT68186.1 MAG: hypothetical protein EWV68_11470 [Microcystis sp. M_QC_C_20170808_M9Col]